LDTIKNVERARVDPRKSTRHRIGPEGRKHGFNGVAIDTKDPPTYESAASYLVVPPPVGAGLGPRSPTRPGKPTIQALERAQGYLKLPNGRALTGFAHEYGRRWPP